jgi:hypothetical protein
VFVFLSATGVTSAASLRAMRPLMGRGEDPESGAILWHPSIAAILKLTKEPPNPLGYRTQGGATSSHEVL